MSIIDWFRKKPTEQTTATDNMLFGYEDSNNPGNVVPFVAPVPAAPAEPLRLVQPVDNRNKDALYTVGINDFGDTILRLQSPYDMTTMTLKMNSTATRQLIRMLDATLQDEEYNDGL